MHRSDIAKTLRIALVACAAFGVFAGAPANAAPKRVMSLFLCGDQLVLDLVPKDRIVSVSFFAKNPAYVYHPAQAAGVPINYGDAEEVLAAKPDLVIAGLYSNGATRALLKQAGVPVLEIPPANSFAEIRDVTRQVGRAVGEEMKAEALIAHMDETLAELARAEPKRPITIAGWEGSGDVPSKGSLFDAIITAAGAVNIAADVGSRSGSFDVERLLMAHPEMLAFGHSTLISPARINEEILHPLVQKLYRGREIAYPELLYACGLPESADAAKAMREQVLTVEAQELKP